MTDPELLEAFLAGELDEAGWAEMEVLVSSMPQVLHELAALRGQEQALRVLLGDGAGDERVKSSVLGDLRGRSLAEIKTGLLEKVRAEDLRKREEEKPIVPVRPMAPLEGRAAPGPATAALARLPRRRRSWAVVAGALAAGLLVAAAVLVLSWPSRNGPELTAAYLLATTPDVRVHRGGEAVPARTDMVLEAGDRIAAAPGAEARIGFTLDPTRITLRGPAELLLERGGRRKRMELVRGEIEALVAPETEGEPLVLATPHSETRLEDGLVRLSCSKVSARLEVVRGWATLRRSRDGQSVRVGAEHYAVAGEGIPLAAVAMLPAEEPEGAPSKPGVGTVVQVQGDVYLFSRSSAERKRAEAGHRLAANQGLLTEGAASLAVVEYPDATRIEIGADTVVGGFAPEDRPGRKLVALDQGILTADVVKQLPDQPMELVTPRATVRVLGTRLVLTEEREGTRVQVEEGAVRFTSLRERRSIEVQSGYFAVAGEGVPFQTLPIPGGARYLGIDLTSGNWDGDGAWSVQGRSVRQTHPGTTGSRNVFQVSTDRGFIVETSVLLDEVAPGGTWGFGLAVGFGPARRLVLRSLQGGFGGSVFGFEDVNSLPFEHNRAGIYRLKLQVERRRDAPALLRGKIWQGEREPDGWMIEYDASLDGPLTEVGFKAVRCACTFSRFRVEVLKDEAD